MKKSKSESRRKGAPPLPRNFRAKEIEAEIKDVTARAEKVESVQIVLSEKEQEELAKWIEPRLEAALNSNVWKDVYSRTLRMREYYEKGVPRTDIKLEFSHDYRSKEAASLADGMRSRLINIFLDEPVVRVEGRNHKGRINAPAVEKLLDYHHTKTIGLANHGDLTVGYLVTEGHAVWYSPWVLEVDEHHRDVIERQLYAKEGETKWVDVDSAQDVQAAIGAGFQPITPEEYDVQEVTRPEIKKNHPELQVLSILDYINPKDSKPNIRPQWEGVRQYYTYNTLMLYEEQGKLNKGALDRVKKYLRPVKNDAEEDVRKEGGDPNTAIATDLEMDGPEPFPLDSSIATWVVWGWIKFPGQKFLQQGMTVYHKPSKTVLFQKLNPYLGESCPIFHLRMIQVPWRFSGIGVMELAVPGEQALNDLSNYILDDGLILNGTPFKYKRKRFPNGISPFEVWKGVGVDNMNDIAEFNIRDRRAMDMNVGNFIRANTERSVGIGDLQLGRESDVTGKQPPTARGIMSIVREGQVRFNLLNFSMINKILEWAEYEILLFQQLASKKTLIDVTDEEGQDMFPDGISKRELLGAFKFVPNTSAQGIIRELDAQLNVQLYQLMSQNKLIASDTDAYYKMTMDVLKSSGKKNIWLSPLSKYHQAQGHPATDDFEESLTPDEKDLADALAAGGTPPEMIKEKIKLLRGEAPPITPEEAGIQPNQNGNGKHG